MEFRPMSSHNIRSSRPVSLSIGIGCFSDVFIDRPTLFASIGLLFETVCPP